MASIIPDQDGSRTSAHISIQWSFFMPSTNIELLITEHWVTEIFKVKKALV